jgi:putative transposase
MPNNKKSSKSEEIALFRFSIISPVIHNSQDNQASYFKDMADNQYTLPDGSSRKFYWRTFKSWLRLYREKGFDGLKPKNRTDTGVSRVVSGELENIIRVKLDMFPSISAAMLYRILTEEGSISSGSPSEGTLRLYIKTMGLRPKPDQPDPRKKFEKPFVNDLWITDFLHGPGLLIDGKKSKVFLTAVIDDHSRFIVGYRWAMRENTETLELALKDAFSAHGLPKMLYCDNGAVYVSHHLQLASARLGIALVHSKPYDSPSRGKIERFFRTVRLNFLSVLPLNQKYSIDSLNQRFREWLDHEYHRRFHHGIHETPLDRYINNIKNVSIRRVNQNELDICFYHTFSRKVKNDSTISIDGILFEVPAKYIGSLIEIRRPAGEKNDLWIYEQDKPVLKIHPVDIAANSIVYSSSQSLGIKFNSINKEV